MTYQPWSATYHHFISYPPFPSGCIQVCVCVCACVYVTNGPWFSHSQLGNTHPDLDFQKEADLPWAEEDPWIVHSFFCERHGWLLVLMVANYSYLSMLLFTKSESSPYHSFLVFTDFITGTVPTNRHWSPDLTQYKQYQVPTSSVRSGTKKTGAKQQAASLELMVMKGDTIMVPFQATMGAWVCPNPRFAPKRSTIIQTLDLRGFSRQEKWSIGRKASGTTRLFND